ncbi:MAG: alpha/beta hydrolase [Desulfobacterales bacterium]
MPSKALEQVIELLRSIPPREEMDIVQMRTDMENAALLQTIPEGIVFSPVDAADVPAEWIIPEDALSDPVILYLHGGGYVMGSINTHRAMVARIAAASKCRALLIDYRLAPENPFPAAVEDATSAYRWLVNDLTISPESIAFAGDSAGGGLALSTVMNLKESSIALPAAIVCISAWADLAMTGESLDSKAEIDPMVKREGAAEMAKVYLAGADPRTPLASPLYGDFSGFPPMLIQVGTAEVLLDDSVRLADKAKKAGVDVAFNPWPDMIHVWHAFADILPEAKEAIKAIGDYISNRLK